MPNKYSYIGGDDLIGRIFIYEEEMKKYDLNSAAIRTFAKELEEGNLAGIQTVFEILDDRQKQGLLNMSIDYNEIWGNFMNFHAPHGRSIELANEFKHPKIAEYLVAQTAELGKAYIQGAALGALTQCNVDKKISKALCRYIGTFLNKEEGGRVAQTSKAAANSAREEEEKIKSQKRP